MKAVLFDMDGVIIDSENYYMNGTFNWLKEKGFKGDFSEVFRLIGTTIDRTYEILCEMLDYKFSIDEIARFNTDYFTNNPMEYEKILNKGVVDLLSDLKEKSIKVALCSSSPRNYIENVLSQCGIYQYFDYIISAEDVKLSKPDPEIYIKASKFLNVIPSECIVIEDSVMGIQAGKSADMEVVALRDKRFGQNQAKADYIFDSFEEISDYLSKKISNR